MTLFNEKEHQSYKTRLDRLDVESFIIIRGKKAL